MAKSSRPSDLPPYQPPPMRALLQWSPEQKRADYRHTFSGEIGQRVLFDLLHRVLMHGSNPFPPGPDPSPLLLAATAGKQAAATEIMELMAYSIAEITSANLRSNDHED